MSISITASSDARWVDAGFGRTGLVRFWVWEWEGLGALVMVMVIREERGGVVDGCV